MPNLYTVNQDYALLLYASENQIYLRYKNAENFGRQIILANNYSHGLCEDFYHGVIFYAYVSTKNKLILRNTQSMQILYLIDLLENEDSAANNPQLCVYKGQLIIFYLLLDTKTAHYHLHCDFPFHPEKNMTLSQNYADMPYFTHAICNQYLFLIITYHNMSQIFGMDENFILKPITDMLKNIPDNHPQLLAWEQKYIKQEELIQSQKNALEQSKLEINTYKDMIERAKYQYNDLMHVAEKYREEAIKWRSKFTI